MIPFDLSDLIENERVEANKFIARAFQKHMGASRLSEAYECLSKRLGFKDWNTASAAKVDFRSVIKLMSK